MSNGLHDFFVEELRDLYDAEGQVHEALPELGNAATSSDLRLVFETQAEDIEAHIRRLEDVFECMSIVPRGKPCRAMEAMIAAGKGILQQSLEPEVLDAALLAAMERVKHYEIASYGAARIFAQMLGEREATRLLQQTLEEEVGIDKLLRALANAQINSQVTRNEVTTREPMGDEP